jgi:hypothetical protein
MPDTNPDTITEIAPAHASQDTGIDRRGVFSRIGAGAASAVAIGALAAGGLTATTTPAAAAVTDVDILNFALNLEYLEAEYYLRAVTGQGLGASDTSGTGTQGTVTGGSQVPFVSPAIAAYAQRLAVDEQTHVRFLRAALGSSAVAEPKIDLVNSFNTLAVAAGLIVQGQSFNPFASDVAFLLGAFVFEDVGVTAYNGAATLISNSTYLQAAASILAIEAYHAGSIRTLLANIGAGVAANAISALRGTLGGGNEQGIIIPGLAYNAVAADVESLAFRRTTTQVLDIVYGNTSATPGLFFPAGLNGNIK